MTGEKQKNINETDLIRKLSIMKSHIDKNEDDDELTKTRKQGLISEYEKTLKNQY